MDTNHREESGHRASLLEHLSLFLFLLLFWLVLSGRYDTQSLLLGAVCVAVVTAITPDRFLHVGRERPEFGIDLRRISPMRSMRYGLWLLWAIVRANVEVAYLVLHPRMPVDPQLVRFRVGFENRLPQVILAHSITLTPGTVTIDLDDEGTYLVHVLVPRFAKPLLEAETQNGVAAAAGEALEPPPTVEWLASVEVSGEVVGEPYDGTPEGRVGPREGA